MVVGPELPGTGPARQRNRPDPELQPERVNVTQTRTVGTEPSLLGAQPNLTKLWASWLQAYESPPGLLACSPNECPGAAVLVAMARWISDF
mgnify:CR=1 FL=1